MSPIKFLAALALAAPAVAVAQVGPNPAVNGSLDPTVGPTNDSATAPDDVATGDNATAMSNATDTPATTSDPATATAAQAKRTTAPTSETTHKKPR